MVSASNISSNISGNALELLISQDETRLNASIESIKFAVKDLAKKILRLYKQYALFPRLAKIIGENGQIEMFYFSSSDISSDDIELENITDGSLTLTQRREMIFNLLDKGLLNDENGQLSNRMKCKVLEMLGLGIWENGQDVKDLHIKKADNENLKMLDGVISKVSEIDDDNLHLNEHIAFMLGEDFENSLRPRRRAGNRPPLAGHAAHRQPPDSPHARFCRGGGRGKDYPGCGAQGAEDAGSGRAWPRPHRPHAFAHHD